MHTGDQEYARTLERLLTVQDCGCENSDSQCIFACCNAGTSLYIPQIESSYTTAELLQTPYRQQTKWQHIVAQLQFGTLWGHSGKR